MVSRYSFIIACGVSILTGCAGNIADKSKIPLESARPERDGIIFVTLGTQQPKPFHFVSMGIRPLGQGGPTLTEDIKIRPRLNRAYFEYKGTFIRPASDFSDTNEAGALFVAALPPGDYEIYSYSFSWRNYTAYPEPYFSVPFRVRTGEALYLGRFIGQVTEITTRDEMGGLFKSDVPARALFAVRSTLSADVSLLEKRLASSRGFKVVDGNLPACTSPKYVKCLR